MTAKEKLKAAIDRLTEAEAANAEIVVKPDPVLDASENAPLEAEAANAEADTDRPD